MGRSARSGQPRGKMDTNRAMLELKAHKLALAFVERRIASGLARRDLAAQQWLEVLRDSFRPEADMATVQRNLHALYDQLYKAALPVDRKEPLKPCPLPGMKVARSPVPEASKPGEAKALIVELRALMANLDLEYSEVSAPHVVMGPGLYFLCACHLGRSMELGRTYADPSRSSFLNEYPRMVMGVWIIILLGILREVATKLYRGESATHRAVAISGRQPPTQRSTLPAAAPAEQALAGAAPEARTGARPAPEDAAGGAEPAPAADVAPPPPPSPQAVPQAVGFDVASDTAGQLGGSIGSAWPANPTLLEKRHTRFEEDRAKASAEALGKDGG